MSEIYIASDKFPGVVEKLMGRYRVCAPVQQGQFHEFAELKTPGDADLGYSNTKLSPKGLFHPQAERMFTYSLDPNDPETGIMKEAPKDYSARVVLGIRPCDAKAFCLDDANFVTEEFVDPWWKERRDCSTLVGLACNEPCSTCFCTSVGTGPFDETGLDVLMVNVDGGYVLKSVTGKGEEMLSGISGDAVPAGSSDKIAALKKGAEAKLGKAFDIQAIAAKPLLDLYNDSSIWEETAFGCINCGTCTFTCPTCWCFDIQDETQGEKGDRIRMWDSCMFPLFTHHGSGHNPRANKPQRVRQRFMHKLKYYQDKYGKGAACVGCGRCVRSCPVNIDIRQVARLMSARCSCPA